MSTLYPSSIDNTTTLPVAIDNTTPVAAASVNVLNGAIVAVEAELGVKPAGTYGTVVERLNAIQNIIAAGIPGPTGPAGPAGTNGTGGNVILDLSGTVTGENVFNTEAAAFAACAAQTNACTLFIATPLSGNTIITGTYSINGLTIAGWHGNLQDTLSFANGAQLNSINDAAITFVDLNVTFETNSAVQLSYNEINFVRCIVRVSGTAAGIQVISFATVNVNLQQTSILGGIHQPISVATNGNLNLVALTPDSDSFANEGVLQNNPISGTGIVNYFRNSSIAQFISSAFSGTINDFPSDTYSLSNTSGGPQGLVGSYGNPSYNSPVLGTTSLQTLVPPWLGVHNTQLGAGIRLRAMGRTHVATTNILNMNFPTPPGATVFQGQLRILGRLITVGGSSGTIGDVYTATYDVTIKVISTVVTNPSAPTLNSAVVNDTSMGGITVTFSAGSKLFIGIITVTSQASGAGAITDWQADLIGEWC